ncbi:MAG: bifunctional phosphoglucose/phosphomannose isomerase [Crocinitomicaceae bacterium]|nr:bifunctional phosphoglucose/phosphomannose isomerase [Crocinitomicaceae bacterium]
MEKLISAFPNNIKQAIAIAKSTTFSKPNSTIQNVVICGMGGSGIGGRLVQKWVENEIQIPVTTIHDYFLPKFISKNTLLIASSYSGNTEETIYCVNQAIEAGAHIVGVCSGGKLEEMGETHGFQTVIVPGGNPPRTALAFSLTQLLHILNQFNLIGTTAIEQLETARQLIVASEKNIKAQAMEMAKFLKGYVGILYGTTAYEPVLIRARQQFNENSKLLCWHHVIPEMNHNELVGWGGGDNRFATIFFDTDDISDRNARRLEITKAVIDKMSDKKLELKCQGNNLIERSIYIINVVDWASLYLSDLNKVDPVDIAIIDYLKGELSNF